MVVSSAMLNRLCVPTLLVSSASACRPCLPLDQVKVSDPATAASPELREAIDDGINDMVAWMGADAVCLTGIKVEERGWFDQGLPEESNFAAVYGPETDFVWLSADTQPDDARRVIRHEICHAWDAQHELQSLAHDRALSRWEPSPEQGYGTRPGLETIEAFAVLCEDATSAYPVHLAVDAACSDDPTPSLASSLLALMQDEVFPRITLDWPVVVSLPPSVPVLVASVPVDSLFFWWVDGGTEHLWLQWAHDVEVDTDRWEGRTLTHTLDVETGRVEEAWVVDLEHDLPQQVLDVGEARFLYPGYRWAGGAWKVEDQPWRALGTPMVASSETASAWMAQKVRDQPSALWVGQAALDGTVAQSWWVDLAPPDSSGESRT